MGSSASKPADSHVWRGYVQTGVSQNLLESIEASNETDVSRIQSLELHIQERVTAELKRLREQEAQGVREAQKKLAAEPAEQQGSEAEGKLRGASRQEVSKVIDNLRAKLEERKQPRQLPEALESAQNEVVRCLRENDRRPLDCWREVEAFKEQVRRLERGWVDKVVS
ncbi:uncharacterized protein C8A04DRAFT_10757 [Dichotomopilus funicola]|uniref:MICOS complex subunit mic19 n=1 Tax=Dichotomopilus funicola TaxID=1934379 RepID=A0AAN6V5P1_9PEZI|nr:hypothetical protein C8A04DRAFT_10757 [Dichotomopilus funicola]